ncbi:MAG: diguanylate cyclase [Marinobacter sp.]|uniref:diguanylate cyclase n=1 Tax=Marinobacter sp. TaxID=50741 RepID=UPI0034A04222
MPLIWRCNASLLFVLLLLFACKAAIASNIPEYPCGQLAASSVTERQQLLNHICYFAATDSSPAARASHPDHLEAPNWQRANGNDLVLTQTDDTYWIQLAVTNPSTASGLWYLKLGYAPLDNVQFWLTGSGERRHDRHIATGDHTPFHTRGINYRYYLVPVAIEAGGTKTITLKIKSSGALNVPLSLEQPDDLIADSNHLTLSHGIFYGSLLIFSVFNLLLFFSSGTRYYFYNAFYMVSTGMFLCAMGGFAYQYFWPTSPWFANASIPIFQALSALAIILFGRSFLEIDNRQKFTTRLLTSLASISVVLLIMAFVLPYTYAIKLNTLFGLFTIGTLFIIGLLRWRQGYAPAKWYVLSWSLMVVGTCIYALAAFGYLADFLAQEMLMHSAIGAQIVLLNYAIVQRWRLLHEKLLEVEYSAKHELELKVHERTAQLRDTMHDLERANRKLAELSTHDSLTGLHNRRFLDAMLPDICAESRRTGKPAALVLVDADHFKTLNDTWGHGFGDECLQKIADVLTRHIRRPRDVVARFGGEEFALVLPNTEEIGALNVSARILADMAATELNAPDGSKTHLTLSAGLAILTPGESESALFARADDALYRAKARGRNRSELSDSGPDIDP